MKTFRLALLGSVVAGIGVMSAVDATAGSDVKKTVKMYGHVNRMVGIQSDGNTVLFNHMDNDLSGSRFGVRAKAKGAHVTIEGRFEWAFQANDSNTGTTTQRRSSNTSWTQDGVRWSDVSFATKYGKLFIGQGSTSSDNVINSDLSGTTLVLNSGLPLSAGMGFSPQQMASGNVAGTETNNSYQVVDVLPELDGNSRRNRIRYDTPSFAGVGLSISNSLGGNMEYAVTYGSKIAGFKIKAKIAHTNKSSTATGWEEETGGSISVLHNSGVSATYAYGTQQHRTRLNSDPGTSTKRAEGRKATHYGKVGYQKSFTDLGKTYLGVDWNVGYDGVTDGDRASKLGVGVVQKLSAYGTEIYGAYEWLGFNRGDRVGYNNALSSSGSNYHTRKYHDIHAGYFGARVKW